MREEGGEMGGVEAAANEGIGRDGEEVDRNAAEEEIATVAEDARRGERGDEEEGSRGSSCDIGGVKTGKVTTGDAAAAGRGGILRRTCSRSCFC